jgi:peptidyl-prolyl cis-trans isomerase A (cyclophilin A)/peptidyl-prolyl cis-trans isomerase B (cyclophilin B)
MNVSIAPLVCLLALLAPAAQAAPAKKSAHPKAHKPAAAAPAVPAVNPRVALQTNKGRIVLEVYADKAPKTAKNFLDYVKSGFYNNTIFHRVIPGFMIQGGGFTTAETEKPTKPPIKNEADNMVQNQRGTVAMARTAEPDSASAQFFINLVNNGSLNHTANTPGGWGYTVFANVVEGMDVVDAIAQVKAGPGRISEAVPQEQIVIQKATILPAIKPAAKPAAKP